MRLSDGVDTCRPVGPDWNPADGYRCRTCRHAALTHPQTNRIWGCLRCGMSTAAVAVYFETGRPEPLFSASFTFLAFNRGTYEWREEYGVF